MALGPPGLGAGALRAAPRGRHPRGPRRLIRLLPALALLLAAPAAGAQVDVDDPLRAQQPGLDLLGLPTAWATSTGEGVVIAIVDTGVDLEHPDLIGHLVAGRDLVDGDDDPDDENGHGTHVAGIAAAVTDNGQGVAGAAPGAQIMPVRVLDADGRGLPATISEGITWAVEHGADVINLSLGGGSDLLSRVVKNGPVNRAVRAAAADGAVVIAAAGNDATYQQAYRRGVPALVVNAVDADGRPAEFSTFGDPRAVAAPGVAVLSTTPIDPTTIWPEGTDGYEELDGTSMAAPHVAGVAALLVAEGLTAREVRDLLTATAANPEGEARLGAGVVDAATAVEQAGGLEAGATPGPGGEEKSDGGLPPALVGGLALTAALVAVLTVVLLAARRPRTAAD